MINKVMSFSSWIFRNDIERLEQALIAKEDVLIATSYFKFWISFLISNKLKQLNGWIIFLIDKSCVISLAAYPHVRIELKSIFYLTDKDFYFMREPKKFIPDIGRVGFIRFLFNEIKDYPVRIIMLVIILSPIFINTDLSLLEKLTNANLSIITIFISIYLVFVTLHYNNDKSKDGLNIDEFYSGAFHQKHEDNRNIFLLALSSIGLSLLSLSVINLKVPSNLVFLLHLARTIGRYKLSAILVIFGVTTTFLCLFNIVEYYLKLRKYEYYDQCIEKILLDQKGLAISENRKKFIRKTRM